jgi:hypothetical protein
MISRWPSPFRSAQMGEMPSTTRWPGITMLVTTLRDGTVSSRVISVASSWSPAMPWGYRVDGLVSNSTRCRSSTSSLASGSASTASLSDSDPSCQSTRSPLASIKASLPESPSGTGWVISEAELVGPESNRPATNFPRISVGTNRVHYLVEKSGLDVDPRRLASPTEQGESRHVGV